MPTEPCRGSSFPLALILTLSTSMTAVASGPIVFVSERDGNRELYTTTTDDSAVTRITNTALAEDSPQWSPAGDRIAFTRGTHTYTIAADGSDLQGPLGTGADRALDPAWSPDGLRLAVQVSEDFGAGDDWEIYTMDADGMNFQPLTVNMNQDRYPDWSPDGSRIVIARDDVLTIIDATTGADIMSYPAAGTARYPAWSPDGTMIAYSRAATGWNLAILDVASGMSTDIVSDGTSNFWPAWSPSGGRLIFASDDGNYELFTVDADGSNLTPLPSNSMDDDFFPDWRAGNPEPLSLLVPRDLIPPVLDGNWPVRDWQQNSNDDPALIDLVNGQVRIQHDRQRLYIQFNMLGDDGDDPIGGGGGDEFWLLFDVDRDGQITGNLDRRYRLLPGTGNMRYETFMPGAMDLESFNPPAAQTFSARGEGFGCFVPDDTLGIFPFHCDEHRLWEIAIDLRELNAIPDGLVNMGLFVKSGMPSFEERIPSDLLDFESYIQLELIAGAGVVATMGPPLTPNPLEPTQAIQDPGNPVDLVQGKDTVVRVSLGQPADFGTAFVNLFGQRAGMDLQGSPLHILHDRTPTSNDVRASAGQTAQFRLPASWTTGSVSMWIGVRQPWIGSAGSTSPIVVDFIETVVPTYWVVPYDISPQGMPPNVIPERALRQDELETISVLPLTDIEFVRRPVVENNPASSSAFKDLLNAYLQGIRIAWADGRTSTGTPPFELPEQLIGVLPAGFPSTSGGTTIGSSDPVWWSGGPGSADVVWIANTVVDLNLAHELNHNLDMRPMGSETWGRHVPNVLAMGTACNTEATGDSAWPYSNDDIQQYGWALEPQFADVLIPNDWPDFMSYCRQGWSPNKWISTYRWEHLLAFFEAPIEVPGGAGNVPHGGALGNMLFVSGRVFDDGSGALDPITAGPGESRVPMQSGDYELRLVACNETILDQYGFSAAFVDVELEPRDMVPFTYVLPDPGSVCFVRLLLNDTVLYEIEQSQNGPVVSITSPNGGENWTGDELISWNWSDADGDELSATILYTSDDEQVWLPVATGITDTGFMVDSLSLPGNETARIKIIVTDGLNTSSDESDGMFTVAPKPPKVSILSPGVDDRVTNAFPVAFLGSAYTAAGFPVPEEQLVWYLDGEEMGMGENASASLDIGTYEVELRVIEGGVFVATDMLSLEVKNAVQLFSTSFEAED